MINDCAGLGLSLRVLPVPLSIVTFGQSMGKDCRGEHRLKLAAFKRQVEDSVVFALLANSTRQNVVVFLARSSKAMHVRVSLMENSTGAS